ncbi:GAF domain-containing protein [Neisseria weixii]|uniref:GAF domain-containing protein n=1 Tax=Neisseria weixii TaxID=1853276 RepID=A0A3N4MU70_9NEIS|nr:GAF domain-containing protein [Neisseria weixii]ATD64364.1 diguanylate cyclase [Neisseria weixii]RPD86798.1 GAF domain-containing protein [Neisseria weixii]RPD87492.1 GAF domain-containing protein [Neisseria weixii]
MHSLHLSHTDKAKRYQELLPQIESVISGETNLIANLANTAAILKEAFGWFWVGFYLVEQENQELVLAPFQGPLACTRIPYGRGVCGQAWSRGETIVVEDVNQHPDHIACSSLSQSEIVVPLFDSDGHCYGVLDVDDDKLAQFDGTDACYLNELADILSRHAMK